MERRGYLGEKSRVKKKWGGQERGRERRQERGQEREQERGQASRAEKGENNTTSNHRSKHLSITPSPLTSSRSKAAWGCSMYEAAYI